MNDTALIMTLTLVKAGMSHQKASSFVEQHYDTVVKQVKLTKQADQQQSDPEYMRDSEEHDEDPVYEADINRIQVLAGQSLFIGGLTSG